MVQSKNALNNLKNVLSRLYLDKLLKEKDWISQMESSQFMGDDVIDVPLGYMNCVADSIESFREILSEVFKETVDLMKCFCKALNEHDSTNLITWGVFKRNNILFGPLLCLVQYNIQEGLRQFDNYQQTRRLDNAVVTLALVSCELYLVFICIPGSHSYDVFQSEHYCSVLRLLKRFVPFHSSQPLSAITDRSVKQYYQKVYQIIKQLDDVLKCIKLVINASESNDNSDCLRETMTTFFCFTFLQTQGSDQHFDQDHGTTFSHNTIIKSISKDSYAALTNSLKSGQDSLTKMMDRLFIVIRPLYNIDITSYADISFETKSPLETARKNCTSFLKQLVIEFGKDGYRIVKIIMQKIFVKIQEKRADIKSREINMIYKILHTIGEVSSEYLTDFIGWFLPFCNNFHAFHRICALELALQIILENKEENLKVFVTPYGVRSNFSAPEHMIGAMFERCIDSNLFVKLTAFSCLTKLMGHPSCRVSQRVFESIFLKLPNYIIDPTTTRITEFSALIPILSIGENGSNDKDRIEEKKIVPLPTGETIINLALSSIANERIAIKKSALIIICHAIQINPAWAKCMNSIDVLERFCLGESSSIRKTLVIHISELLDRHPSNADILNCWIQGVLPLVNDPEQKVSEEVIGRTHNIVSRIVPYSNLTERKKMPLKLLEAICKNNMRKDLKCCLKKSFNKSFFETLETYFDTDWNHVIWFLLVSIAQSQRIKHTLEILRHLQSSIIDREEYDEYCGTMVLETVACSMKDMDTKKTIPDLVQLLVAKIEKYVLPICLVTPAFNAIEYGYSLIDEKNIKRKALCDRIFREFNSLIKSSKFLHKEKSMTERVRRKIFTFSEAMLLYPKLLNQESLNIIEEKFEQFLADPDACKDPQMYKNYTVILVFLIRRAIQDPNYSENILQIFKEALDKIEEPIVVINILCGLCDLTQNHSALAHTILPRIYLYLKAEESALQYESLQILISWIQQDFVQLSNPVIFFLLILLFDQRSKIKKVTHSFFANIALRKDKDCFLKNFILSMLHFNQYKGHPYMTVHILSEKEHKKYYLGGPENASMRLRIYQHMILCMTDEQKGSLIDDIIQNLVSTIIQGGIRLNKEGNAILEDFLAVFALESLFCSKAAGEDDEDEVESAEGEEEESQTRKKKSPQIIDTRVSINITDCVMKTEKLAEYLKEINHPSAPAAENLSRKIYKMFEYGSIKKAGIPT